MENNEEVKIENSNEQNQLNNNPIQSNDFVPDKKSNNGKIIICIILIIILICACGYIVYSNYFFEPNKVQEDNNIEIDNTIDNNIDENNEYEQTNENANITDENSTIEEVIENEDDTEEDIGNEDNLDDSDDDCVVKKNKECNLNVIGGTKVTLKNTRGEKGRVTSDLYINDKFSKSISYYDICYNNCDSIIDNEGLFEVSDDYFIISFSGEGATSTDNYLFNKNGKFISNFEEWNKKYDLYSVSEDGEGGIIISSSVDYGFEQSISESYCELKAKPTDVYETHEYLSIKDDKLSVVDIVKINWSDAYKCDYSCTENTCDCGDIRKVKCN